MGYEMLIVYFACRYVAVCASIKNQAKDMTEWLVHHYHHHGIRRFYIMESVISSISVSCLC